MVLMLVVAQLAFDMESKNPVFGVSLVGVFLGGVPLHFLAITLTNSRTFFLTISWFMQCLLDLPSPAYLFFPLM